jgi:hypothetical protein
VTPEVLTVTGTRGAVEPATRTLALRATEPIAELQVQALDLYNHDRDRVFPQDLITVPDSMSMATGEVLATVPVAFNLQAAPSGEFQGILLLSTGGEQFTVPVTVRVKDAWYGPLALLLLGVILGTSVSSYSRWGKTSDELTVGVETLRTQVQTDREIPPSFAASIAVHLADAQLAREARQLDQARQSLTAARELWGQWFRERSQWLSAIQVGQELQSKLAQQWSEVAQTAYLQGIQQDLQKALNRVASFDNAATLGQQLNRLSDQAAHYLRVWQQLRDFQNHLGRLHPHALATSDQETLQDIKSQADDWKAVLNTVHPSDADADATLRTLSSAMAEAAQVLKRLQKAEESFQTRDLGEFKAGQGKAVADSSKAEIEMPVTTVTEPPTTALDDALVFKGIAALIKNPQHRLQFFAIAGYLTTIGFLAGAGFNQLYLENPTFGSSGLRDYFALLAWGFGAEATRSTVTTALRRTEESGT